MKILLTLIALAFTISSYAGNDPKKNAIKARQGDMNIRAFNLGPLFAMAKGKMDYDAELAGKLANNLNNLLKVDLGSAWAQGSDNKSYPDDTTALPEIWTTYPEIGKYAKKYASAIEDLQSVADKGLDQLRSKIGNVGKSCKGCHDEYRAEH